MTQLSADLAAPADVQKWLAAERVAADYITPILVDRFRTMLGRPLVPSKEGDPAPLGLHWALGPDGLDPATLGPDGRPRGTPGVPSFASLKSEMWAGAETTFARPLRVGDAVEHRSRLVSLAEKKGRNGQLVFATENHEYSPVRGATCVSEQWSVVFKASSPPTSGGAEPMAREVLDGPGDRFERTIQPTNVMLFQYSALTYNAHRVHFDHPYAADVEGYPGILIHGPLTATFLLDTCVEKVGADAIASAKFRAEGPAYCGVRLVLTGLRNGREVKMLAQTEAGAPVMRATVTLRG